MKYRCLCLLLLLRSFCIGCDVIVCCRWFWKLGIIIVTGTTSLLLFTCQITTSRRPLLRCRSTTTTDDAVSISRSCSCSLVSWTGIDSIRRMIGSSSIQVGIATTVVVVAVAVQDVSIAMYFLKQGSFRILP